MYRRKGNVLLIGLGLLGGAIGYAVGEVMLAAWSGHIPAWLLMGAYFGQLFFWIGGLCLAAEHISPVLNGKGWRSRYAADGWKYLVPAALLLVVAGALTQFVYGLYFGIHKPPKDILIAIDVSESMLETDPQRESFRAAKELIGRVGGDKRVAIISFNHQAELLQPLVPMDNPLARAAAIDKLDRFGPPSGTTDIAAALAKAMEQIEPVRAEARGSMLILISDGYSEVELDSALMPYRTQDVVVNTVGVNPNDRAGNDLLRRIAAETGGMYHSAEDVRSLSRVFEKIYMANQGWHLVGERTGSALSSMTYAVLRIVFIAVLGLVAGLAIGIVFDNRYLARSFSFGGAVAGLLAGFVLEEGQNGGSYETALVRGAAWMAFALLLTLSTLLVPYREKRVEDMRPGPDRGGRRIHSDDRTGRGSGFR